MTTEQAHPVLRYLRKFVASPGLDALTDGQLLERFVAAQEEAAFAALVRRHGPLVLGVCRRLLRGVCADPAMLVWLDGGDNRKEHPNENFAREFLELFTLGLGRYTEKDVREAARAFTGWVENHDYSFPPRRQFHFDRAAFDDGEKTFLGRTGHWQSGDIVRITLEQPACAEFLCRKLYRFFVSENAAPPADLIAPLAQELRSHGYAIRHVVEVILRSRHFFSAAAYRQRLKGPVEFSAGLVRVLAVPRGGMNLLALAAACERQGQDLFYPPNVKGWDGGRTSARQGGVGPLSGQQRSGPASAARRAAHQGGPWRLDLLHPTRRFRHAC